MDRVRKEQLGKEEIQQTRMDLSDPSSSSRNLSQSKSMHVSELMEDTSAQVRSQTSGTEWWPK